MFPVGVADIVRDADVAGILCESDVARIATALESASTAWTVISPFEACPVCRSSFRPVASKNRRAVVLDVDGLHKANHTPKRCRKEGCEIYLKNVWGNFIATKRGERMWMTPQQEVPNIIMLSQSFGVTKRWYRQFSRRMATQWASFWGEATVHWSSRWQKRISFNRLKLNLEDAWMKIRLLERRAERPTRDGSPLLCLSAKLEETLRENAPAYDELMRRRRKAQVHASGREVTGVVIDGHQKTTRRCCGVPLVMRLSCPPLGKECLLPCSGTPVYKEKFCRAHLESCVVCRCDKPIAHISKKLPIGSCLDDLLTVYVEDTNGKHLKVPPSSLPSGQLSDWLREQASQPQQDAPQPVESVEQMLSEEQPDAQLLGQDVIYDDDTTLEELLALSCKTHKHGKDAERPQKGTAKRFRHRRCRRTGGVLMACSPDGFLIDVAEFYGAESLPQRYFFLARLRELYPGLKVVVHDDACHLRRFADNRQGDSDFAASLAYPNIIYVVDRFHARGHVDPWCLENVHPKSPLVSKYVEEMNTSICEITFTWLSRFKHMYRKMNEHTSSFFMQEMIDERNAQRLQDVQGTVVAEYSADEESVASSDTVSSEAPEADGSSDTSSEGSGSAGSSSASHSSNSSVD